MRRASLVASLALATLAMLAPGCSALVDPDPSLLGDRMDAGGGGGSDGGRRDGGGGGPVDGDVTPVDAGGVTPVDAGGGDVDAGGVDVDAGPTMCPPSCDDSIACTTDDCHDFTCRHVPVDGLCPMMQRCNPATGCVPRRCMHDRDCADMNPCNGDEQCVGDSGDMFGCAPGTAPDCADDADCTTDACDPAMGCTHTPVNAACNDMVDCTADTCSPMTGGADSRGCVHAGDDTMCNGACTMGARCEDSGCTGGGPRSCADMNVCTTDSCAEPAGCTSVPRDADGDSYPASFVGTTLCMGGTDCDDTMAAVNPGAMEVCANGRDDNCNGTRDEGCPVLPDTCLTAQAIPLVAGVGSVRGTLGSFMNDYTNTCDDVGGGGGRDAIYYIDITATSDITIDTLGGPAGTDTVVAVALTCGSFSLACNDDIQRTVVIQSRVWVHRLVPGPTGTARRLYIMVDGFNGGVVGDYVLNVRVVPAAGDACREPIDISGGGSMLGFITPSAVLPGGPSGSCQPAARALASEAIATFTGPGDGTARFDVYSGDFTPDLYVRSAPCATGTELACNAGVALGGGLYAASLPSVATPAGSTNFVFVDGASTPAGYLLAFSP